MHVHIRPVQAVASRVVVVKIPAIGHAGIGVSAVGVGPHINDQSGHRPHNFAVELCYNLPFGKQAGMAFQLALAPNHVLLGHLRKAQAIEGDEGVLVAWARVAELDRSVG